MRAARIFKDKGLQSRNESPTTELTSNNMIAAKNFIFKQTQRDCFKPEVNALTQNKRINTTSRLRHLSPFLDEDGLLRARGRLEKSQLDYCIKHTIILNGNHPAVHLFKGQTRKDNQHSPRQHLKNILQNEYWILCFRAHIDKIIKNCYDCRRQQATGLQPELAPLPAFRFPDDKPFPFQQTGLDLFGSFASKTAGNYNKRYVVIMTCLTTRAVHLEMCQDQSADAFINTLRRLFARRGQPVKIVSDNGTNFTAAEKELSRHFDADVTRQFYANHQIELTFNPAYAPHLGGVWERLIRSVKDSFYAIIGSQILTDDIFNTVFCEVEHFMNARPITTVSASPDDVEALTPNHFFLGRAHASMPPLQTQQPSTLSRQWKFAQQLATHIWKRLMKEFLPTLLPRQRWTKKTPPIKIGKIVWILQDMTPRGLWPIGRITRNKPTDDDQIRVYFVKIRDKIASIPAIRLAPVSPDYCN
ncbi:uncharacterized protein LOC134846785 [Symsagittifera roscoffensis]|uniref:uncharacterized protein LOC134846785 n=1 Tax=Symsagittifera roscoffensis TaxID=84072 RepID=UPI00307C0F94